MEVIINIRMRQVKFLGHIMRKVGLENWRITEQIQDVKDGGSHGITYIRSLRKCFTECG